MQWQYLVYLAWVLSIARAGYGVGGPGYILACLQTRNPV